MPTNDDFRRIAIHCLGLLALLAIAFGLGYGLGLRNAGAGLSAGSHGAHQDQRAERVGSEIDRAAAEQRQITAGIGSAEESARGLQGSIDASTDAASDGQTAVSGAAAAADDLDREIERTGTLIDQCQSILRTVQKRAEKDQTAH